MCQRSYILSRYIHVCVNTCMLYIQELDKAADGVTLEAEHHLFDDIIWPALAKRVPAFEELKVLLGQLLHISE